jgi:hypothetical protein
VALCVDCDLDRTVPHLLLDVGQARSLLDEERSKGVAKGVECDVAQSRRSEAREKVAMVDVAAIQIPARSRREPVSRIVRKCRAVRLGAAGELP